MELKILKEEKSALPRKELEAVVTFESETPSREAIKEQVAKKLKAKDDLIIVKTIHTYYGDHEAKITAYIYDNADAMKAIEFEEMIKKNMKPEPKKEEEKPAEQAPSETEKKPSEEEAKSKEEPTKEEKPAKEKEDASKEEKKGEE